MTRMKILAIITILSFLALVTEAKKSPRPRLRWKDAPSNGTILLDGFTRSSKLSIKFTPKKEVDKLLYIATGLELLGEQGSLGTAALIWNFNRDGSINGYERFYLNESGRSCQKDDLIKQLPGVEHVMKIDIGSEKLFKFTVPGQRRKGTSLSFADCRRWDEWEETVGESVRAHLEFQTWVTDLEDYLQVEYAVHD